MSTRKIQLLLLFVSCWLTFSKAAEVALPQYTMDQRASCISAGFLDIPRGQTTILQAPSTNTTATETLSCRLQFSVQNEGDTLNMTLDPSSYFESCEASLELQMVNSNSDKITRGCKSPKDTVTLSGVNGKASVWFVRQRFDDNNYQFRVTITAVGTETQSTQGLVKTDDVGNTVETTTGHL
ncbi:hypothetical protein BsWGS_13842 [Bradybaena similaris]